MARTMWEDQFDTMDLLLCNGIGCCIDGFLCGNSSSDAGESLKYGCHSKAECCCLGSFCCCQPTPNCQGCANGLNCRVMEGVCCVPLPRGSLCDLCRLCCSGQDSTKHYCCMLSCLCVGIGLKRCTYFDAPGSVHGGFAVSGGRLSADQISLTALAGAVAQVAGVDRSTVSASASDASEQTWAEWLLSQPATLKWVDVRYQIDLAPTVESDCCPPRWGAARLWGDEIRAVMSSTRLLAALKEQPELAAVPSQLVVPSNAACPEHHVRMYRGADYCFGDTNCCHAQAQMCCYACRLAIGSSHVPCIGALCCLACCSNQEGPSPDKALCGSPCGLACIGRVGDMFQNIERRGEFENQEAVPKEETNQVADTVVDVDVIESTEG